MLLRSILPLALGFATLLIFFWGVRPVNQTIQVSHAHIQTALSDEIAEAKPVGLLVAVKFSRLNVTFDTKMRLEGTGAWFSAGAGAFVAPDISVVAEVPFEPISWSYTQGRLVVVQTDVTHAFRDKVGLEAGRDESEANRAEWEKKLRQFMNRSSAFVIPELDGYDWRVASVVNEEGLIKFRVERSGFLASVLGR